MVPLMNRSISVKLLGETFSAQHVRTILAMLIMLTQIRRHLSIKVTAFDLRTIHLIVVFSDILKHSLLKIKLK